MNKKTQRYPLFNPNNFHDACGVGFVATTTGRADPKVLPLAISALQRLTHRGAKAYDGDSGDGSGLLVDIPKAFFTSYLEKNHLIKMQKNDSLAIAFIFAKNISNETIKNCFIKHSKKKN
ncbi:MAG: hypothetical protein ACJZ1Y_04330 [Candidatus Neomarinimicrobiota bacterium]